AVLDDWDPRVIDGIAARHRVIAFDNRGGGGIDRINRIAALAYVKRGPQRPRRPLGDHPPRFRREWRP
ncbi:MAG TPA: hypothetical protein VN046_11390, partial [Stenotrophobium sp.]|nr:hypothetical protein [Stenotrophobium sp.]